MPDYSFIARGLPPIDIASPLMQVEQIRQQRAAQAMQQQSLDLDQQAMGMQMADFAAQRERQAIEAQKAEEDQRKRQMGERTMYILRQVASSPNPQETGMRFLPQIKEGLEALGLPFDESLTDFSTLAQAMGIQQQKPEYRQVGGTLLEMGPNGPRPVYTEPERPGGAADRAPAYRDIVDPTDPNRLITIDGNLYRGGGLGSPGVIGVAGKEPSALKREEQRGTSRQAVDDLVTTLRDQFTQLNEGGGITNTDSGVVDNISAGIASSGPGQAAGRLLGTKNQSLRNQIQQTRPRLLSAIMAATGMSARQLDSNAELKLWLSAATDPTLDFQANMEALNNIVNLYGTEGSLSTSGGKPQAGGADKNGDGVVDWKDL